MNKTSLVLLLVTFVSSVSCSSNDDQSGIEPTPDMNNTANPEQNEPDGAGSEEVLMSTASLQNSGTDTEVPVLAARTTFGFSEDTTVALSPDGSELAKVIEIESLLVSIYSTETQALVREFSLPSISLGVSKFDLVLWGQDDVLSIIDKGFVGHTLNAKTGETLATKEEPESSACSLGAEDISGFNPLTNKLYCVKLDNNGMVNLIELDTRTLASQVRNTFTASSLSSGVRLSHDGSEVAFTVHETEDCCLDPTTLFVSTETFQPSREKQMNKQTNQVMGNGFDINLDIESAKLFIGNDGTYIESSSDVITANYTRTIATIHRPIGDQPIDFSNGVFPPDTGYRVITLPEGIVVGDIVSPFLNVVPEFTYMSIDGTVLTRVGQDYARVYDIDSRTNYTALTNR